MTDHNYYTALSHAVLAGTSIYCLLKYRSDMGLVCYGLLATNSLLGVWRWGNPEPGENAKMIYTKTSMCQEILCIGAVATEIWRGSPSFPEFCWAELILPLFPLTLYFMDREYRNIEKGVMAFNGVSIIFVSAMTSNYWGAAAAVSYVLGYLYAKDQGSIREIPVIDLINYELCFFSYFALRALGAN